MAIEAADVGPRGYVTLRCVDCHEEHWRAVVSTASARPAGPIACGSASVHDHGMTDSKDFPKAGQDHSEPPQDLGADGKSPSDGDQRNDGVSSRTTRYLPKKASGLGPRPEAVEDLKHPERSGRPEQPPEYLEGPDNPEGSDYPEELTDFDLAAEAKDDWDSGARPALEEILIDLEDVNEPTKDECRKLVIRIKRKGAVAVSQGSAAQQPVLLTLIIDLLMLTDTVDSAHAADDSERVLLEKIGKTIKGKLALSIWGVISKLGKLQQWTVQGEASISLFSMVTGTGSLSITFGK